MLLYLLCCVSDDLLAMVSLCQACRSNPTTTYDKGLKHTLEVLEVGNRVKSSTYMIQMNVRVLQSPLMSLKVL